MHPFLLSCPDCGSCVKGKKPFKRHLKECRKSISFTCDKPKCRFSTSRKENLDRHKDTVHKIRDQSDNQHVDLCVISDSLVVIGSGSKLTLFKTIPKKLVEIESVNTLFKIAKILKKNDQVFVNIRFLKFYFKESLIISS